MIISEYYHYRQIDNILSEWKNDISKKPLLIRGARQVGKSSAVRNLSKEFRYYIEINFDQQLSLHSIFQGDLNPVEICEKIAVLTKTPVVSGETLLFFDEIQSCIPAISSLRYFYEQMPGLHVIAAGSLLEFAMEELPSYAVGRIRSVYMYPFSFDEFLIAMGESALLEERNKADNQHPLHPLMHEKLLMYLKKFLLTGGMPEAVANFVRNSDLLIVQQVLDDLLESLKSDFSKYKKKIPGTRIVEVFESAGAQTGNKFVYYNAIPSGSVQQVKDALELLILAGLVIPVTHTNANGIPLGAEANDKKRKMILLDTALYQRINGLDLSEILISNDFSLINKGNIAEMFVGLELLKYQNPFQKHRLFYWQREAKSANAEVDYIIQKHETILPVEVKSSGKGSMQSLFQFLKEKKKQKGIRISLENFSSVDGIDIYPLYAVKNILS